MDVHPQPQLNHRFTVDVDSPRSDGTRRDIGFERISSPVAVRYSALHSLLGLFLRDPPRQCIEFRRAVENDHFFFDWHKANLCRKKDLRTLTIYQLDQRSDKPIHSWRLEDCWIDTWRGPAFDAMKPAVAIETFSLCYRSLSWLDHSDSPTKEHANGHSI